MGIRDLDELATKIRVGISKSNLVLLGLWVLNGLFDLGFVWGRVTITWDLCQVGVGWSGREDGVDGFWLGRAQLRWDVV